MSKRQNIIPGSDLQALRNNHQFIRDDDRDAEKYHSNWEVRMARKFYDKLYREYACINLSRYKEAKFGLRWRTENEVISGKGQHSCASTACEFFDETKLTTFELPFVYKEEGEDKNELVKVKLCPSCQPKLMYKKNKKAEEKSISQATSDFEDGKKKKEKDDNKGPEEKEGRKRRKKH